jgi:hypothetical protein
VKATETDVLIARAQAAKPSRFRRAVLFFAIRFEWRWLWRLYVSLLVATLAGCSFEVPRDYTTLVHSYREEHPNAPAGCLTVWVESGSCEVEAPDGTRGDCAVGDDVYVVRQYPGQQCSFATHELCDCGVRPKTVDGKVVWQ